DGSGGDGAQSSHWKDDHLTGHYIGVMDPSLELGKRQEITANDLKALDLMGYQLKSNASPNPTPTPTPAPGGDTVALTSGAGKSGTIPGPQPGKGQLGETQYTIQVPSGATQLKVTLSGAQQDVDLFVRYGARVAIQNGNVVADFKSETPTSNESVIITP